MKRSVKNSGLYQFLEKTGVLNNGSAEDIATAKKNYWKEVRKAWRLNQRQNCKSYTIFLEPSEQRDIERLAKAKFLSITSFIKQSALYRAQQSPGIDKIAIGRVRQVFFDTYKQVEEIEVGSGNIPLSWVLDFLLKLEKDVLALIK